jgi:hypothetical protein
MADGFVVVNLEMFREGKWAVTNEVARSAGTPVSACDQTYQIPENDQLTNMGRESLKTNIIFLLASVGES